MSLIENLRKMLRHVSPCVQQINVKIDSFVISTGVSVRLVTFLYFIIVTKSTDCIYIINIIV